MGRLYRSGELLGRRLRADAAGWNSVTYALRWAQPGRDAFLGGINAQVLRIIHFALRREYVSDHPGGAPIRFAGVRAKLLGETKTSPRRCVRAVNFGPYEFDPYRRATRGGRIPENAHEVPARCADNGADGKFVITKGKTGRPGTTSQQSASPCMLAQISYSKIPGRGLRI